MSGRLPKFIMHGNTPEQGARNRTPTPSVCAHFITGWDRMAWRITRARWNGRTDMGHNDRWLKELNAKPDMFNGTMARPEYKAALALARQMTNPTREQVKAWAKLMKAALKS